MSPADSEKDKTGFPLRADPASGAIVGTFLLAIFLAGPVGLVLAVIAWVLIDAFRRRGTQRVRLPSEGETTGHEYAARFKKLENDILRDE